MISIRGEIHSSKNSNRIFRTGSGSPFVTKSKAAKADETMLYAQLVEQADEWRRNTAGLRYPLYVCFAFRRKTNARWDFANLVQGIADAMTVAGYIPDDDVQHFIPVYEPYTVEPRNPGVDFWIKE